MIHFDVQGSPLPEIVDFRITGDKKKAIFFIREGETFYRKRLDLKKEGAGLKQLSISQGHVHLAREEKLLSVEDLETGIVCEEYLRRTLIVASARRDVAQLLALVFWGQKLSLEGWPEPVQEEVQPFPLVA